MKDVKLTYSNISQSGLRLGGAKGMGFEFRQTVKALDEQIEVLKQKLLFAMAEETDPKALVKLSQSKEN